MAITKKSIVGNASTKNSTKSKTAAAKADPVTPAKMVPAVRLGKAQLHSSKSTILTGMARF
jgi:hypothetical protein